MSHYNIITGHQLPEQIIIGMVNETAHTGDIEKNPFNFQHFDCSEASLVVNGIHEPAEPYKIDISAKNYVNLYSDFLLNTGISNEDRDFGLHEGDYLGGNFSLCLTDQKRSVTAFTDILMTLVPLMYI